MIWRVVFLSSLLTFLFNFSLHAQSTQVARHALSPVYESMLRNQIEALRGDLFPDENAFYVKGWGSAGQAKLAGFVDILSAGGILPFQWRLGDPPPGQSFHGVVLVDAPSINGEVPWDEVFRAGAFLKAKGNAGFLFVEVSGLVRSEVVQETINKEGLQLIEALPEWELEFVQNEKGRQILDLNQETAVHPIYERLVYEGMNPVVAWPEAVRRIQDFRTSQSNTILVVGKV